MEPAEKKRKLILGGALIATLIAVVMVEDEEELTIDTVETLQPTRSSSGKARVDINTIDSLEVDLLGQRAFNAEAGELFKSTSWVPKRPQITLKQQAEMEKQRAKAKAPPAPTPPPLPFKYIGKVIEGNKIQVFLADSDEYYVVKLGGHIENQYRVDTMDDETITLTYLPLDARQTLTINDKKTGNIR